MGRLAAEIGGDDSELRRGEAVDDDVERVLDQRRRGDFERRCHLGLAELGPVEDELEIGGEDALKRGQERAAVDDAQASAGVPARSGRISRHRREGSAGVRIRPRRHAVVLRRAGKLEGVHVAADRVAERVERRVEKAYARTELLCDERHEPGVKGAVALVPQSLCSAPSTIIG